jgi:RNA polymerase sigma-70 factor (ECF subfamily)
MTTTEQPSPPPAGERPGHPAGFGTTHWSVVLAAGRSDTTRAREALGRLCQSYWYPLYAYVRRRGHPTHDAQDLTQEFFARFLERQSVAAADPERGRFRSFILTAMNHFLISEWNKARAQKRGGDRQIFSMELAVAEERFNQEPADNATPEKLFERQWALTLLNEVLNRLEDEYRGAGKNDVFLALKETLTGTRESQPYEGLAAKLGMNEGAIKVAVHRLRRRYRELIRAEIASTLDFSQDIDEEMRHLFSALTER